MAIRTFASAALNAICPYYTMFPLDFPLSHLTRLRRNAWVLDPFCGRGTTAFAARLLKLNSLNIDANPVAIAIAKAKLASPRPVLVAQLAQEILSQPLRADIPPGLFWELAYDQNVLIDLVKLRTALLEIDTDEAAALRGVILGALHGPQPKTKDSYFSNQMPRTFSSKPDYSVQYWQKHGLLPRPVNALAIIKERIARYYHSKIPKTIGLAQLGDARTFTSVPYQFDALVTSPPYFGMGTYVEDQWLRNWFVGGPPQVSYYHGEQLGTSAGDRFISNLANVWSNVAPMMRPDGKVVIRMGTIASKKADPEEIIKKSVRQSNVNWRLKSISSAGASSGRHRQANHMGKIASTNSAEQELDFVFKVE